MGGPLDHSVLREIETLLDAHEVGEAQIRLSRLGDRRELSAGVDYLTTRLLHVRGKLDWPAVADRLRDLLARSPNFTEASALLEAAERIRPQDKPSQTPETAREGMAVPLPSSSHKNATPLDAVQRQAAVVPATAVDTSAARGASWPPEPKAPQPPREPRVQTPPTTPASEKLPPLQVWEAEGPTPVQHFEGTQSPRQSSPPGNRPITQAPRTPRLGSGPPGPMDPSARRRLFTPLTGFDSLPHSPHSREEPGAASEPRPLRGMPVIPRAPALPVFRDNTSAPSYAPGRAEPEIVKSKSLLPRNAGRYSEMPASMDVIEPSVRYSKRAPNAPRAPNSAANPPITARDGRPRNPPQSPNRIRSGQPPLKGGPTVPTLFEIASWIDQGRHRDAIAAINRSGTDVGPEYAVLRARALAGAGYVDQAFDALERLEHAPLLDPELKAACSRLFVELGAPHRALPLAERALEADPERPIVQLTYALAAVRSARREANPSLLSRAARVLEQLHGREGPLPALYQALKACVEATSGDPDRAISIAQRALGLDQRSPDAFAAIAEASARAGRVHGARQAWTRLAEISLDEADALESALARLGVPVGARAEERDPPAASGGGQPWMVVEGTLVAGGRTEAIRAVELAAHDAVRRMTKSVSQNGPTAIATVAAGFLTTTPVFSSFAPYDVSLWSIRRVEAAIDVLYGAERRQRGPADDAGIVMLLGSYLGESVRLGHDGHWEGQVSDLDSVRVVVSERHFYPFRVLTTRLRQGRRASISEALSAAASRPDEHPWRARIPNPMAPPVPWGTFAWPRPSEIGRLGRSIAKSPIGKYCEDFAEGALDRTTASLIALDTYLELIAPRHALPDPDAAWTRRVAVFVGGYLGETLRGLVGGDWVYGLDTADDALAFKLQLRGSVEAMPVAHVLERVIGERSSSLVDYAKTMMRRAGRT